MLLLSGCVVETRRGQSAESPQQPAPPPPPPAPPAPPAPPEAAPPAPPQEQEAPEEEAPPPTGRRETMRRAPSLKRDPADPPPSTVPLPPQPPAVPTPPVPPRVIPTLTEDVTGVPPVSAANPRAFWIWRTPEGVWKLRTTTGNKIQQFHGVVRIRNDRLSQLRITRTELERRVDVKDQTISFDFATSNQIEGMDFTTEKPLSCVYFRLSVIDPPNRVNDPKDVFIGPKMIRAPREFNLCPKK
jgi:hypothetical protein